MIKIWPVRLNFAKQNLGGLERLVFYFLIFVLPFQTRLILKEWGAEFNEWNSAFLYFTDLLIFALLFFWASRLIFKKMDYRQFIITEKKKCSLFIVLCLFFVISGLSLFSAQNLGLGIYQLIKLVQFILLFFYIKSNFKKLFNLERACQILIASGIFQVFVGICQFSLQKNLGLKIFGESPLGPNIDGVAKIVVSGVKMIRAYGTFPHPNVFAAFLLFSIFCFYFLYLHPHTNPCTKFGNAIPRADRRLRLKGLENAIPPAGIGVGVKIKEPSFGLKLIFASIFVFLVFGLFLTFSRTLIVLFFISSIFLFLYLFFKKALYRDFRQKTAMLCAFFLLAVLLCAGPMFSELYSRFIVGAVDPGINLRYFYNFTSLSMIKENPFFGIGIGNFVWRLQDFQGSLRAANLIYKLDVPETEVIPHQAPAWLFQPVHNIFLLIATEIGIFGLLIFLIFLGFIIYPVIKIIKENNLLFIVYCLLFIVIAAAITDHFFWTLQQGKLMFWILAGILVGLNKKD